MKKEILKQLRSSYDNTEIKPSNDLWDRIDAALEKGSDLPVKQSFQWWKYAAVVLLLISFGVFFYFNPKSAESNKVITKSDNSDKSVPAKRQIDGIEKLKAEQIENEDIAISGKKNNGEIKTEKSITKSYTEDLKSYNPILVKAEEEKNIHTENINVPIAKEKTHDQITESPIIIAEKKKASYIKADELLLGREIDKTREENHGGQKRMGVVDMEKIKIKGPNSLKILGMTVFSDSSDTE
jgi:hypothetical protein